ncbi:MAG TPA: FAD-dependent monooxygenase [Polyangiaceae bacterium]|nr:FAD-dependent monooxygenase [Polyangiaceae bacterium]
MTDPVLVVGAGPTGMTAALELSRLGIRVRLVEKSPERRPDATPPAERSRAIGVQARTLELLDIRGLATELLRSGHPTAGLSLYGDGKRLVHLDFSGIDSRHHYLLFVSQMETERVLREALAARGVDIERGVELVGFAQDALAPDPSPVQAVLRHAGGRLERARAPWLIDAEGAHSVVRATLGLPFEGRTIRGAYALGDIRVDGDLAEDDFHLFSTEHGFMGLFPFGGRRFRIIAGVAPSMASDDTAPTLEDLQAIFDQRSPVPARLGDLRWSSWFRINSRMVRRLRVGRVLLGGDAAHIHSPAGGQGMNTGIQDMVNLAWKLALVMTEQAPEALLDTYEAERLPVVRSVLDKSAMITDLMSSRRPVVRRLLRRLAPRIGRSRMAQRIVPFRISQLAVGYRRSPMSMEQGRAGRLRAGDRVPDVPVHCRTGHGDEWHERSLFEVLDPGRFTLLVVHAADADGVDWCGAVRPWPVVRVVGIAPPSSSGDLARFTRTFGRTGCVVLVRPDGYVGFGGGKRATPADLARYCQRWLKATCELPSDLPAE